MQIDIFTACERGDLIATQKLIEKGADVNRPHKQTNEFPLYLAAFNGHTPIVEYLLSRPGVKVDQVYEKNGGTALHAASSRGHTETVKALVQGGASLTKLNKQSYTPLMVAAEGGIADTAKLLCELGADPNFKNPGKGTFALQLAAGNGYQKAAAALVECKADVNLANNLNETSLFSAAHDGHVEVVRILLDNGAHVNTASTGKDGSSPLQAACVQGNFSILQLLLEKGAKPNVHSEDGSFPLYEAANYGRMAAVKLLLKFGADIHQTHKKTEHTALWAASDMGHYEVAKLLLHSGNKPEEGSDKMDLEALNAEHDPGLHVNCCLML